MAINIFDRFKQLYASNTQGTNPFNNENFTASYNQPFEKQLAGINAVPKEVEPEFDLTQMSMELDDNSFNASGQAGDDDRKRKEEELLAQVAQ